MLRKRKFFTLSFFFDNLLTNTRINFLDEFSLFVLFTPVDLYPVDTFLFFLFLFRIFILEHFFASIVFLSFTHQIVSFVSASPFFIGKLDEKWEIFFQIFFYIIEHLLFVLNFFIILFEMKLY